MLPHLDLQVDVADSLEEGLGKGRGLTPEALAGGLRQTESILKGIWDLRRLGQLPFLDLPYQEASLEEVLRLAAARKGAYRDIVLCGFGGSALGTAVLVEGTQRVTRNLGDPQRPRLFILDTLDSATIDAVWDFIDPGQTLFLFNSHSGKTVELLALYDLLHRRLLPILGGAGLRDHIFVMAREGKNPLWERAQNEDIPALAISPGVIGRFSVLTPLHLLPAALCQVDILSLIQGAKRMDERVDLMRPGDHPSALLATVLYLWMERARNALVIWPYVDRLSAYSRWFRQLVAESLGKRLSLKGEEVRTGMTPLLAQGVATQHAELQLYLDGPLDKFFLFFTADGGRNETDKLLAISQQATERAMVDQAIPSARIELPEMTEYCLGQLLLMSEVTVALLGSLMEVNPYDQPGVEAVKRYVLKSLTV